MRIQHTAPARIDLMLILNTTPHQSVKNQYSYKMLCQGAKYMLIHHTTPAHRDLMPIHPTAPYENAHN